MEQFHGTTILSVRHGTTVALGGDGQVTLGNVVMKGSAGNLMRASVELAKDWRTDRMLRRLEAMLLVADRESTLIITGNGDVLEPEDGIGAIGSGGSYAQSAAKALQENTELSPTEIVKKSLTIAGQLCIYTNLSLTIESLD